MGLLQAMAAVFLLLGNFYFVAVEFSITKARPTMVTQLEREGVAGARSFAHAVRNIDAYLSACQLGITVCSVGLGIAAEPLVKDLLESLLGEGSVLGIAAPTVAFVIAYAIVSMFHVVLGELAPKSLAIARTRRTGLLLLPPMRAFYLATKPIVDLFNWMGNAVLRPFGIPPASEAAAEVHTEDELRELIQESVRRGALAPEEEAFAVGAFTFGDRRAHEVMVPRRDVIAVEATDDVRDAARRAAASRHRLLPLVSGEGGLDAPVGVVDVSDLLGALADGGGGSLEAMARPLPETSSSVLLDDLLEELRERGETMALVRDEHGTAVGILTLEDLVEQVVGSLPAVAEPDTEDQDGRLRLPGSTDVHGLARDLGVDFGAHHEATIGGLAIERLGHVPQAGEEVESGTVRLRILGIDGTRVTEVELVRPDDDGPGE
jgi:CBS domain containing-hemolysin-like protein